MRTSLLIILTIYAITSFISTGCKRAWGKPESETIALDTNLTLDSTALVARGDYLVNAIGCADCHSPKRMGPHGPEIIPELHLSGFPSNGTVPPIDLNSIKEGWILFNQDGTSHLGPWGQSFAGNLTSDPSGIGNWTEENFIRSIREGKYKGLKDSRNLLPLMPWEVYKNLNDEDLRSIFYYLKTTKPVNNMVPPPKTLEQLQ